MKVKKNWSVYLLRCADRSLYCGVTNDFNKRLARHNEGTASKYTRSRLPVKLAAIRENLTKVEAFRLEYRVKKVRADQKKSVLLQWNFEI